MMISPEIFADELEGKSYRELLAVRDELAVEIAEFESDRLEHADDGFALPEEIVIKPGPDVVYQMDLLYLAETCKKLSEQFNREFEQE
ncbi:MAG: hypothetical protein ACOX69_08565 [Coriobacteriales bacterium]|jgi:hypothetical protein